METIDVSTLTPKELYWEFCRYRQQFGFDTSDRTFRRWKQKLGIEPCEERGIYFTSDLEALKMAVRRVYQGQTLDQISQYLQENYHAYQSEPAYK